jgi:hypothetical protein
MGQQCCPSGPGDERLEAPDQPTSINSPFRHLGMATCSTFGIINHLNSEASGKSRP